MCNMSSSNKEEPIYIGLTGGIGCGKTTVLKEFRRLGIPCFVADEVAGKYYEDQDFVDQVCQLLGDDVMGEHGKIDKRKIASKVFKDKSLLSGLNQLVHPRVIRDFKNWASQQNSAYVIFESAILYEHGLDRMVDRVVCVYLEKEERLRRLSYRDHATREVLEERMKNQWSAEDKMCRADWIILNYEGNPRRRQVKYVDACIRREIQEQK